MRTDNTIDKILDVTPIICDIVDKARDDKDLRKSLFQGLKEKNVKPTSQIRYLAQVVSKCKEEVFNILAIVYEKSIEEVKAQDFIKVTLPQIKELWLNKDIRDLFFSSATTQKTEQTDAVAAAAE